MISSICRVCRYYTVRAHLYDKPVGKWSAGERRAGTSWTFRCKYHNECVRPRYQRSKGKIDEVAGYGSRAVKILPLFRLVRAKHKDLAFDSENYFPFNVFDHKERALSDSSFIPFLRYSFYRPRDILAYLSIMKKYSKSDQSVFSWEDFDHSQVQKEYSLASYHPASDFDLFRDFFQYLKPYVDVKWREFNYNDFVLAYNKFTTHIVNQGNPKPLIFQSSDYVLQSLFELNIIAYIEDHRNGVPYQRWYFKERSHAKIRPKVKINATYRMHKGIAQALYVVM